MSEYKQPIENSQRYLRSALIVVTILLVIATYFAITGHQSTKELSDAEAAVEGARAIYIEGTLKNNPDATYASSNCEFNALNEHYNLVDLLSIQDRIDDGKATEAEIQELRSTVKHCQSESNTKR